MNAMFDDEELGIAARHRALAHMLRPLNGDFATLVLDATTLDNAAEYVLAADPDALNVADAIRTDTGKGFLYHVHEHVERHARHMLGILTSTVPLADPRALQADRTARIVEARLESLLCHWIMDEQIGFDHFLWSLCITGDPTQYTAVDANKSRAVGTRLGVAEPANIDRKRICAIRESVWNFDLKQLSLANCTELSYSRWRVRGRPLGDDWDDWFSAEAAQVILENPVGSEGSGTLDPWTL